MKTKLYLSVCCRNHELSKKVCLFASLLSTITAIPHIAVMLRASSGVRNPSYAALDPLLKIDGLCKMSGETPSVQRGLVYSSTVSSEVYVARSDCRRMHLD